MQKTVLIGITGCIAAYKACEVVRGLQKAGFRVKVVMTENATRFVGPATFKALTREPVAVSLFDAPGDPIHHVSLAKEADLFLIVPCTANVMAKVARGIADDLLTTTALAMDAPLMIAPAMNVKMWDAEATQENLEILRRRGVRIIAPVSGHLACGDEGEGKLADVDHIVADATHVLDGALDLEGVRVLVTAGPTYEPIDPVRFIGNRSSGKTGYAIASEAASRGALVTLVSGPTALDDPTGVETVHVESAQQMLDACRKPFSEADVAVFSAAVADFAPATFHDHKIKKSEGGIASLDFHENPDILAILAATKGDTFVVGFAAETDDVLLHAGEKLRSKNADLIVANCVACGKVFGADESQVTLVSKQGISELALMDKRLLAAELWDHIVDGLSHPAR